MNVVTIFPDRYAKVAREIPYDEFEAIIANPPQRPSKGACELVSLVRYGDQRSERGSLRSDANAITITGIAGDYDAERMAVEQARDALGLFGVRARLYTTPSYDVNAPRWRAVCPLSRELPKSEHTRLMARLNGALGGVLADESFTLSQSYYFGAVTGVEYVTLETAGRCIDELPELDDFAIGKDGKPSEPGNGATPGRLTDDELRTLIVEGEATRIYPALLTLSSRFARRGKSEGEIVHELEGLLNCCEWQQRAPKTWAERFAAIPGFAASAVKKFAPRAGNMAWPEPQPLVARVASEPYPVDALPKTLRAAVEEVQRYVKAPMPLVVASALAAVSVAVQAHFDVQRDNKLSGPSGLFLLTLGESGERKSTCDKFFLAAVRQYEKEQADANQPVLERHQAEMDAWTAQRDGLLLAIKDAGKKSKPVAKMREELAELQRNRPTAPRVPRLLLGDETPENLAWGLAKEWPSVGVISAEAGVVFGSHGMGKDSIMRNLSLLNTLWDGGNLRIGRRTSESFTVRGARLTMGLQIQEPVLRSFLERGGTLARGGGFLARFLVSWPESTQGFRLYEDPPSTWPALSAFHQQIAWILADPAPIQEDGTLTPALLTFTPEAKALWRDFHDAIEVELRPTGELHEVRDVASKIADNATRLGALFQVFEHGAGAALGAESFAAGSRLAAWHLHEARRFFGELALPIDVVREAKLDAWLVDYCRREQTTLVPTQKVQQFGPAGLREKAALEAAVNGLDELGRAHLVREGRRRFIRINPALLS
jgi:hypothetical protein